MKRSKEFATRKYAMSRFQDGRIVTEYHEDEVRVMARAEGYAMVRRKGAMPFVVHEKSLFPIATERK